MLYIGVDLGTSAVKMLLMDGDGKVLATSSRSYEVDFPRQGWSEQNPSDWLSKTLEGIEELIKGYDPADVKGIGAGGQMHGLVILDEQDEVIRPAILWNDGRSEKQVSYLNETIGRDKISSYTANIAFAGFTAPKLLWLRENEPESYARIAKIMLPKDYLVYRLTGVHATDLSDASGTLLLDVEKRSWSREMCQLCGVKAEWLPKLYESYEAVGKLLPEYERLLGMKDVKVAAGAGDNAAAAIGTGTVGNGGCNISLGTSGTVFISSEEFRLDDNNALHSFCHGDGNYHLMGCTLSAASCAGWWMNKILKTNDFTAEQQGMEDNLGCNQVFFLPYLMGERSPHNDVNARGSFIGMTLDTDRRDMLQAVLEGVSFGLRDSVEIARKLGIKIERSKVCGGGAKNKVWLKMLASILNMKLDVPAVEEGPSMGSAMLAAVACGHFKTVSEACDHITAVKETIEPDLELVKAYDKKYALYKNLYPALRDQFKEMAAIDY